MCVLYCTHRHRVPVFLTIWSEESGSVFGTIVHFYLPIACVQVSRDVVLCVTKALNCTIAMSYGKVNGQVTVLTIMRYEIHRQMTNLDQCTCAWSGFDANTTGDPHGPSSSSMMSMLNLNPKMWFCTRSWAKASIIFQWLLAILSCVQVGIRAIPRCLWFAWHGLQGCIRWYHLLGAIPSCIVFQLSHGYSSNSQSKSPLVSKIPSGAGSSYTIWTLGCHTHLGTLTRVEPSACFPSLAIVSSASVVAEDAAKVRGASNWPGGIRSGFLFLGIRSGTRPLYYKLVIKLPSLSSSFCCVSKCSSPWLGYFLVRHLWIRCHLCM